MADRAPDRPGARLAGLFAAAAALGAAQAGVGALLVVVRLLVDGSWVLLATVSAAGGVTLVGSAMGFSARASDRPCALPLALITGGQIAAAAAGGVAIAGAVSEARALGLSGERLAVLGVLVALCAALALAAAVALRRWPAILAAGTAALAASAVIVVGGAAAVTGADCDRFAFDAQRWASGLPDEVGVTESTDRERIAGTLLRCDVLTGRSRAEVRRMLGRPQPWLDGQSVHGEQWETAPNGLSALGVDYDEDGRVSEIEQLYA